LGQKEINAKRSILVCQEGLQFCDLFPEHVWCVAHSSDDTKTSCIGDCGCEFGTGGNVHSSQEDGMGDLEEVGDRCAEDLCKLLLVCCFVLLLLLLLQLECDTYEEKPLC
jgi:hypothetical protein